MPEILVLTMLNELERITEAQLNLLIRVFQNMNEQDLNRPTADGGWSITECLWHLNSYGNYYLPYIQKRLAMPGKAVTYRSGWLGSLMIRSMQPHSSIKMKTFKNHVPPAGLNAREVVAEAIEQFELLASYLKQAHGTHLYQRVPVSISPMIRIRLGDVLQFMVAHNERHLQQAQQNLQ